MYNIVICFPGGGGGHFIASICKNLLYNHSIEFQRDGSAHSVLLTHQHQDFLSNRTLDISVDSYAKEYELIDSLQEFDIVIAHFRNIIALTQKNKKVIYITFTPDQKQILYNRIKNKVPDAMLSNSHYTVLAGDDWPSYDEYVKGAKIPTINEGRDWLDDWYYAIPANTADICEIKFSDILSGNNLIDILSNFLQIKKFDKNYIEAKITEYRKLQ